MRLKKKFLITTADERAWKFDRPVIFLGEWCRLYSRRKIWEKMNAEILEPYGFETSKQKLDHHEAIQLENKIFFEFCELLNEFHGSNYSNRFWLILIGPWFKKIIRLLINRINTLKKLLLSYEITGTSTFRENAQTLHTLNMLDTLQKINDDQWNNILNIKILKFLESRKFKIYYADKEENKNLNFHLKKNLSYQDKNFKNIFFNNIYKFYFMISKNFIKKDDAFIINSYLPLIDQIKLELSLGQWPQLWRLGFNKSNWPIINKKYNQLLRKKLTKKLHYKCDNDLENIIRSLLFELIPVYYLEGFSDLNKITNEQKWPKSPKFIFTSVSYNTDEFFKLWTAKQTEKGTKYFIGQHGNRYPIAWDKIDSIEQVTPYKFITWGWSDNTSLHKPSFIFKTAGKKNDFDSKGRLLLIQTINYHRFTTWDSHNAFLKYINEQFMFVNNLTSDPRIKLIVRLHPGSKFSDMQENLRWKDFDQNIEINNGSIHINKLISKSRLVVHSYDSTGILETLSRNIPTIAFWQNNFDHLRECAKPNYKLLLDAGIIHLSHESAANKVNEVWNDVDFWWNKNSIQDARKKFCDIYARTSDNPITEIKKILES